MNQFKSFVILAEMRTGSNLLEAALNLFPNVQCHGEAFNPAMIGYPNKKELLGVSRAERDAAPEYLWKKITTKSGLNGCRYFHTHDPRVLDAMLSDVSCAKIILTRNPIDSFVSLQIALATDQWKLGDVRQRKAAQVKFNAPMFEKHLTELQEFQIKVLNKLQVSGQAAFYIDYDDVQNIDVLNGLARWLGVDEKIDALPAGLVPQNPEGLDTKVSNFEEMETSLARLDRFNLSKTPNFEPRRGANIPGIIGCTTHAGSGLLYMPLRPAPDAPIREWFDSIGAVQEGFSQKTLRQWKRSTPVHRSFTVVRHPLMRAHLALSMVLSWGRMAETREVLRDTYRLAMPVDGKLPGAKAWADLLEAFLGWIKMNLNGQTSLPVSFLWASQSATIEGMGTFSLPDLIVREDNLNTDLAYLASVIKADVPDIKFSEIDTAPVKLVSIYSPKLEKAARDAYARDFMQFGFQNWQPYD